MSEVKRLLVEHRRCGTPNGYDGCYAHWPFDHCRSDGMAWPCDVAQYLPDYEAAVDALERLLERHAHVDRRGQQRQECEGDSLFRCVAHDAADDEEADAAYAALARLRGGE